MKPIIGIVVNFSKNDEIGQVSGLGLPEQEWQLIPHDYIKAIEISGGIPMLLPLTTTTDNALPLLKFLDGILFTGGNDLDPYLYSEENRGKVGLIEPERDAHETQLLRSVLCDFSFPVFTICRGTQLLNVTLGGSLFQDIKSDCPDLLIDHSQWSKPKDQVVHSTKVYSNSKTFQILEKQPFINVNSLHHQSINRLGKDLIISMISEDGIIEGVEMVSNRFVLGVQWHPETMINSDQNAQKIFKAFINEAQNYGYSRMEGKISESKQI